MNSVMNTMKNEMAMRSEKWNYHIEHLSERIE